MEAADLLYAEGWQFFWLALTLALVWYCRQFASGTTQLAAWMLLAGWFVTNLFWPLTAVYVANDLVFGLLTFLLWRQGGESHLLTVVVIYAAMLLLHRLNPPVPQYMVALNVLYGIQLSALYRGTAKHVRSEG